MKRLTNHWKTVAQVWLICFGFFALSFLMGSFWLIGAWAAIFPFVTLYFIGVTLTIVIRFLSSP